MLGDMPARNFGLCEHWAGANLNPDGDARSYDGPDLARV
jgi:hypothetical protein